MALIFATLICLNGYGQNEKEEALKKQADKNFEDELYNLAYKQFSQLVSLYPKDPIYNYKLGVCMLYTEPDKTKPYPYLLLATKNPADAPKDAKFYLAKTYHVNYRFDEALRLYAEYKQIGSSASIKKLQVDKEIQACKNGKRLLSNLSDLSILSKKQLNEADYFKAYDVKEIGGKLLVKPDDYKSNLDKKKKDNSVVYLPKSGERLYYSSFGESGNNERDIYFVNKLPNGSWSKPQILPPSINTEYDEDYPFLHPNGKTLYFSSKGHNSMGGYDIFKTNFNSETNSWSKPENLEFPINSPDDDILFVTDSLEKIAYFSTGRYSPFGKIDVLKINTDRKPINFAAIKGSISKEEASQSVKSKITVKNMDNGEIVGTFQAQENGDYNLQLPNGGKFIFTVETPGIATQSESVNLPVAYSLKPYKQSISYEKKILKITNYFESSTNDESYSLMLDLIEKKAKLEVNQNEQTQQVPNADNLNAVSTTNPSISKTEPTTETKNLTNEQLLEIAKTDSKEAEAEAKQLKQEAKDAFGLATQKTAEAAEKQKLADAATEKANKITDIAKKEEELKKINQLKEEAKIASDVANIATNLATKLEVDATIQQKEADLTNQYISQLETVIKNKNNKEALTKLEQIQKQLDDVSNQKNQSDELYASLKASAELKQQELTASESKNKAIENEINILKTESTNLEKDLSNETDKVLKENITAQIKEISTEIEQKTKDLETNVQKNNALKNELEGANQEILIAAKILNEKTDGLTVSESTSVTQTSTLISPPIYTSNNNSNPENLITEAEKLSKTASEKRKIAATKSGSEKDNLIKEAIENEKLATDKKIEAASIYEIQNKTKFETTEAKVLDLEKINTTNTSAEVAKAKTLIAEANTSFKQAQKMRIEANSYPSTAAKLGGFSNAEEKEFEALNKQQQAVDLLTKTTPSSNNIASEPIVNNTNNESNNSPETLINDAENLTKVAYQKRKEAELKSGNEKQTLLQEAVETEKLANTKKLEASAIYKIQNKTKFETSEATLLDLQKSNGTNSTPEITQANALANEANIGFKQAQKMRIEAESNPSIAARLGELSNAEEKEFEAIAKQQQAINLLSKTTEPKTNPITNTSPVEPVISNNQPVLPTANNNTSNTPPANLINEAEELTKLAYNLRKEAETKTGAAKEALLKEAVENEKASNDKKLQASAIYQVENKSNFENRDASITELKKSIGEKTSPEITEANTLAAEATVGFSQAQKMRAEAESNQSVAARIGELSNAEEKEFEALAKQQKALSLLSKANSTTIEKPSETIAVNSNTNVITTTKPTNTTTDKPVNTASLNQEITTLKTNLNNPKESDVVNFNNYTSKDAITFKEKANEKLNAALNTDKQLSNSLDNINASSNPKDSIVTQQAISNLVVNADQLNDEAYALRKSASTKTGDEQQADLDKAIELEANAVGKKMEASSKQKSLNINTYENNKTNLEALSKLAVGKNITELGTADMLINEANLNWKQAEKIRLEADNYPSNAAKLGGYNNAEEKELLALAKQKALLDVYQKYFQNYVPTKSNASVNPESLAIVNETKTNYNTNAQNHIDGLLLMNQAIDLEYKSRIAALPTNLNKPNADLKTKAQGTYKKGLNQLSKAMQTVDLTAKKNSLIDANKSGQDAINTLNQISNTPDVVTNNPSNETKPNIAKNTNAKVANTNNGFKPAITSLSEGTEKPRSNNTEPKPVTVKKTNNVTTVANNVKPAINKNKQAVIVKLKANGLEVKPTNAYTADKPIPVDIKLPDGLMFKVQIGAFKTPLPNNTFKGLTPIVAQTTPSGYIRYMAGDFKQFESANFVKDGLRDLGYRDAFVVAYFNGKRITMSEATELAKNSDVKTEPKNTDVVVTAPVKNGVPEFVNIDFTDTSKTVNKKPITETKVPEFVNIDFTEGNGVKTTTTTPKEEKVPEFVNIDFGDTLGNKTTPVIQSNSTITSTTNVTSNELEKINGLLYTIQLGIYSKEVAKAQLFNLTPIYTEKLPNGLYRYTAGIYNQTSKLLEDKRKVIDFGVKDAFVTAYYNGQRIPFAEGQKLQSENNNLKVEAENPVVFSSSNITNNPINANQTINNKPVANINSNVTPFSNGVTSGPIPSNENGVKADENGISFRVQIGAYKNQVPNDIASKFANIKNWPIKYIILNDLFIYNIGNFSSLEFAKKLKDEVIALGITDAYITIYKDGKKLYGSEATQYLSK